MKTFYISFGQVHTHSYNGITLDKDCIVAVEAESKRQAHDWAMEAFDAKFHLVYEDKPNMDFFPRGIINLLSN